MQFNPIPTDAPTAENNKHYFKSVLNKGTWSKDADHLDTRSRWYKFKVGRSDKEYCYQDKFIDDEALSLLAKTKGKRLVVKYYTSPSGKDQVTYFHILTHFGLYHRTRTGNTESYDTYNPKTGELGFYELKAG